MILSKVYRHLRRTLSNERGAITFDGVDDNVAVGTFLNSITDTKPITISAWVKYTENVAKAILCSQMTGGTGKGIQFGTGPGTTDGTKFIFRYQGANRLQKVSSTTINTGAWVHIAATYSGSQNAAGMIMYLNGVDDGSSATTDLVPGDMTTTNTNYVGIRNATEIPFNGEIAELAIWNRVLTAGEIASLYNSGSVVKGKPLQIPTPVMYLPMTDGTVGTSADADTVADWSASGNNGTGNDGANNTGLTWSADPTNLTTPTFPTTRLLDNFNRTNEGPPPSASWTSITNGNKVVSNAAAANTALADNLDYWNVASYGPDCEVYGTITAKQLVTNQYSLFLARGDASGNGYKVKYVENTVGTDSILLVLSNSGDSTLATYSQEVDVGDSIGLSCVGSNITVYYRASGGSWTSLGTTVDTTFTGAGRIEMAIYGGVGTLDDFGGGTYVPTTATGIMTPRSGYWGDL